MPAIRPEALVPGVTETDDFLVYRCASDKPNQSPYRVDKQKFCGNGECDCKSFTTAKSVEINGIKMTKRQALRKGAMPHPSLQCKHIVRVDRYIVAKILFEVITLRERQADENRQKNKARRVADRVSNASQEARDSARQSPQGAVGSIETPEEIEQEATAPLVT